MVAPALQSSLSDARQQTPPDRLESLCREAWGIGGRFTTLPAVCDEVFRLDTAEGERFVLKLTSPHEAPLATDFQTQALVHLGKTDPTLPVPRLIPTRDGGLSYRPSWPDRAPPAARLFTWLDGVPLVEAAQPDGAAMGAMLARIGLGLADFDHPGADHDHDWDLRNTARLAPLLDEIAAAEERRLAQRAMTRFTDETAACLAPLRRQVVHNDFNLFNVLIDPDQPSRITGVIDFGDMVRTALIADVAIAACYVLGDADDPLATVAPLVAAYHRLRPLEEVEIALLVPLMEARHLMTVAITEWRAVRNPQDRASITKNTARAWRGLKTLGVLSHERLTEQLLNACAMEGRHE